MEAIFPNEDRMLRVDAVTQISNFKSQELEMQRKTFKPSATSKRHQKGYTLIELGIAIAILAVLVIGALTGVQAIMTSGKVSDQAKTLGRLQSTISKHYQNAPTAAANQAQLVTLGAWDARSVNAAGVVTSAFGTVEAIAPNGVAIGSMLVNQGFVYTIAGVPQAACTDLAQSLAPLAFAISITANGAAGAAGAPNWAAGAANTSLAKAPDAQAWNAGGIATACAGLAPATFSIALKP